MKSTKPFSTHLPLTAALSAFVAMLLHFAAPSALATSYYWDCNGSTSGFGAAAGIWAAPTTGDATQGWSTSSAGTSATVASYTTTISDDLYFNTAGGVVTVSGTVAANSLNFLTTGGSGGVTLTNGVIQLGGASPTITCTNNVTAIYSPISLVSLSGNRPWIYFGRPSASASMLINGQMSGSGAMVFATPDVVCSGTQTIKLGAANTYTGNTEISVYNSSRGWNNNLTVQALVDNALPKTTLLTLNGYDGAGSGRTVAYDLNGNDQTLIGLQNSSVTSLRNQYILNSAGTAAMLTITNTANYIFSGNINGTALGLTKTGAGTLTLGDINGYTGNTILNAGKLIGVVGGNCASSKVILNSATATLGVSVTDNTKRWTCSALTVSNAGTINLDFSTAIPSTTLSPLKITGAADFTVATPLLNVVLSAGLTPGTYPLMTWGSTTGTAPTTNELTINAMLPLTSANLIVSNSALNLVISSVAAQIFKASNALNLTNGSSWIGSVVPASTNVATWNTNEPAALPPLTLGANLTWAGIKIANPGGPVTLNNGNTLTLGGAPYAIDLSTATVDLTLNCPLALGAADVLDVASGRTLTLNNVISGSFPITLQDVGTTIFAGANTYAGNTTISAGTLRLGAANVIPDGAGNGNVALAGTLDLNGNSETINGLTGAGAVDNSAASTTSTLTVGGNNQGSTFTGVIQNSGSLATNNLVKIGTNTLVLAGANTLSGTVTVSTGTLAVSNTAPFNSASSIALAGGTTLRSDIDGEVIAAPVSVGAVNTTVTITAPISPLVAGVGTTTVSFNSAISGAGNVTFLGLNPFNGNGTINLKTQNTYTGNTLMTCSDAFIQSILQTNNENIAVQLYAGNALPPTTVLTMDGTPGISVANNRYCELNLNGHSQTLAGLTNIPQTFRAQRVINPDTTSATGALTVNNSADYTFSGNLGGSSGSGSLATGIAGNKFSLVKSGGGTFTIAGANTYTGGTTINGGTLQVSSSTGTGDVTINTNGTLSGTGTIAGNVINSGTLLPGTGGSSDTLTISGNLTLNANSTNTFAVDGSAPANTSVALGGSATYDGLLKIVPSGTFTAGQTFTLFSGGGAASASNFASVQGSPGAGLAFSFTNGVLTVASTGGGGPSGPAKLTNSVSGNTLALSWPAGQGWRLQMQTNSLSVGLRSNWVYVTDGTVSSTNITTSPTLPTVFYRLTYP